MNTIKTKERYKRIIKAMSGLVILTVEVLLYWLVWTMHYNKLIDSPFWRRGNWLIALIYAVLLAFFLNTYGGLKVGYLRRGNLIYSQFLSVLFVNTLSYFQLALIDMKFHNPGMFILLTIADMVCTVIWVFLFQWIYSILFPRRELLLVYGKRPAFHLLEKINSRDDKYIITGATSISHGIDFVIAEIKKYDGVIIGDIPSHERNLLLKHCYEVSVRTYMVPKISDLLIRTSNDFNLFDSPLLLSRNDGLQFDQECIKRSVDLVAAFVLLIVTSPLFLIFSILIKADDKGPVFYRQKRLTKDGEVFDILKFRTMRVDAEKDGVARLSSGTDDNRVTPVGKVLRATRLDELPQLINVLHGEMSMVGPRPERPEIAEIYQKAIPEFDFRLKVKAGLTGYAQVYGKYNTTPYDKLKLDLMYIRNYSIWLDLKLMLMTPKVLFMKEATDGIEDGKTTAEFDPYEEIKPFADNVDDQEDN